MVYRWWRDIDSGRYSDDKYFLLKPELLETFTLIWYLSPPTSRQKLILVSVLKVKENLWSLKLGKIKDPYIKASDITKSKLKKNLRK